MNLDDITNAPTSQRAQDEEIERLRNRNRKLEEEVRMAQNQLTTQSDLLAMGKGGDDRAMQSRFYNEIQNLKNESVTQRLASRGQNSEQLRKERNDLQEENRRLVNLVRFTVASSKALTL